MQKEMHRYTILHEKEKCCELNFICDMLHIRVAVCCWGFTVICDLKLVGIWIGRRWSRHSSASEDKYRCKWCWWYKRKFCSSLDPQTVEIVASTADQVSLPLRLSLYLSNTHRCIELIAFINFDWFLVSEFYGFSLSMGHEWARGTN